MFDDSSPPDAETFRELLRIGKKVVLWGGNFFSDNLPAASCWIVWDKKRRGMDQADCELAWTNLRGQSRIFEYRWNGMLQEDMKHKEERIHATQKPVALFTYCYQLAGLKPGDTVLDCYMGSQSSRIAAYEMNLNYIGYEINETYYKLGEERFDRHTAQMNLFLEE